MGPPILHPPVDIESRIECALQHISLDDEPQYQALSYVWGNSRVRKCVLVDGIHPILVTENLAAAPRQL